MWQFLIVTYSFIYIYFLTFKIFKKRNTPKPWFDCLHYIIDRAIEAEGISRSVQILRHHWINHWKAFSEVACLIVVMPRAIHYDTIEDGQNKKSHLLFSKSQWRKNELSSFQLLERKEFHSFGHNEFGGGGTSIETLYWDVPPKWVGFWQKIPKHGPIFGPKIPNHGSIFKIFKK